MQLGFGLDSRILGGFVGRRGRFFRKKRRGRDRCRKRVLDRELDPLSSGLGKAEFSSRVPHRSLLAFSSVWGCGHPRLFFSGLIPLPRGNGAAQNRFGGEWAILKAKKPRLRSTALPVLSSSGDVGQLAASRIVSRFLQQEETFRGTT
jgi:hypothetical protein